MTNENVIEVHHLTKKFKDFTAVNDVTFEVSKGEIFGFLGPNGAGKSTTIRILTTLLTPTQGTAKLAGFDIVKSHNDVRKHIGLVAEKNNLYDHLTAMENLEFFGKLNHMPKELIDERAEKWLPRLGMEEWKKSLVSTFSTGMKQRINIVRALLTEPDVLFLDEPTLGLDPQTTFLIRTFIQELNNQGVTIILTTHDMIEADALCNRVAIIDHGKIAATGTTEELKKRVKNKENPTMEDVFLAVTGTEVRDATTKPVQTGRHGPWARPQGRVNKMKTLIDLITIAKKDLLEFVRDKTRLVTFVIMPIFMLIMVGFIFPSQTSIKNINIGIANQDNGVLSKQLVSVVSNLEITSGTKAFKLHYYSNENEIKTAIRSQDVNGGLVIPANFGQDITKNNVTNVVVVQDQSNPQVSALTTETLQKVIGGFGQGITTQKISIMMAKAPGGAKPSLVASIVAPISTSLAGLFPGNTNYFEFVAPGIMSMIVLTAVLTGLAASVSRERETGTLDGILIAPVSRLSIILGKATAQATRGLAQGILVLILAIVFFGVTVNGSILLVLIILLLGIFSFVGMGILVSASTAEQETATQLLFMFQFPMLFLSGVFFPIQQMPTAMQYIAKIIPLTYAIEAMRKVMILGGNLSSVRNDLIILVVFGAVTLTIAVPVFRRMITK